MSGALTKVLPRHCRGQKGPLMKNNISLGENSSGFTDEQSLQVGAFSEDLLDQKSPLFHVGGGVVTNA